MRSGSTSRPLYVLQFGQTRCASFGCLQFGQTCTRGTAIPCVARRLSRLDLDVFRFGTAIAAAEYTHTSGRLDRYSESVWPCKESERNRSPRSFDAS